MSQRKLSNISEPLENRVVNDRPFIRRVMNKAMHRTSNKFCLAIAIN
jgi:hypothetical protein